MPISIEEKYLIASIIVLVISYCLLKFTKKNVHLISNIQDLNNTQYNKTINLKTCKNSVEVDSNLFEMHMNKLKDNIFNISNNMTSIDCRILKKYLKQSSVGLQKNINNIKKNDKEFCSDEFNRLMDINIVNYKKDLESKFYINNKITTLSDKKNAEELRDKIIDILIDMEIISFLIRNTSCKRNKVDISYLDTLLNQIYNAKCGSVEHFISTIKDDKYFKDQKTINYDMSDIFKVKDEYQLRMMGKNKKKVPNRYTDLDQPIENTSYQNRPIPERYLPAIGNPPSDCISHYRVYGFTEPKMNSFNSKQYNDRIKKNIRRKKIIHDNPNKQVNKNIKNNLFN